MEKARRDLGWLPSVCHQRAIGGFTLAELLIALAILGVIATFTIPKVIQSQQDESYNSKAMEFVASISAAYDNLRSNGLVNNNTGPYSLLPYLNYTSFDAGAPLIDRLPGDALISRLCGPCISFANGSRAAFGNALGFSFGGNTTTNAITFTFDPDGRVTDGTTNGPGKSVHIILFRNGRITSAGKYAGTYTRANGDVTTTAGQDPSWLKW